MSKKYNVKEVCCFKIKLDFVQSSGESWVLRGFDEAYIKLVDVKTIISKNINEKSYTVYTFETRRKTNETLIYVDKMLNHDTIIREIFNIRIWNDNCY